jgi:hypothetical protein
MKTMKLKPAVLSILSLAFFFLAMASALVAKTSITVLSPNGGEILKRNSSVIIKWQSTGVDGKVVIVLYKKGIKHSVISRQTDNNGFFPWKIPGTLPEGNDYRIRIRWLKNLSINDFSDRNFTIKK